MEWRDGLGCLSWPDKLETPKKWPSSYAVWLERKSENSRTHFNIGCTRRSCNGGARCSDVQQLAPSPCLPDLVLAGRRGQKPLNPRSLERRPPRGQSLFGFVFMIVRDSGGNIALFTALPVFGRLEDRFFPQQSKEKTSITKARPLQSTYPQRHHSIPPHIWCQAFDLRMDQVRS